MTTEHDEGFKAGREEAARVAEKAGWFITADDIRNLKPAPRSAEHTAGPSAQGERERTALAIHSWASSHDLDCYDDAVKLSGYIIATAPSTSIEAQPVCPVCGGRPGACRILGHRAENDRPDWQSPDRTPDARSTSDAVDVEAMLAACVPGGNVCDPQRVADSLRAWFADRTNRSTSDAAVVLQTTCAQDHCGPLCDQTLRERDENEEWAQRLADAIADHLGIELGEWEVGMGSAESNNPWQNALDALSDRATRSTDSSAEAAALTWAAGQAELRVCGEDERSRALWLFAQFLRKHAAEAAKLTTDSSAEAADALTLLQELVDAKANHSKPGSNGPERMRQAWTAAREFFAAKLTTAPHTAAGDLPPPYDTRQVEDAYALLWASVPTRDPKPHAARKLLREHLGTIKCDEAIRRLVDSGNGPDGDAIHSALLGGVTTAPHTADGTRVDGGA